MAALALVGAVMTGCSSDEDGFTDTPQQPAATNYSVTKTLRVSLDGGEAGARGITRALTSGGVKTFAVGDQIAVAYMIEGGTQTKAVTEALTADDISNEGKTATFTVTFTEEPWDIKGNQLFYTYPASITTANGGIDYSALNTQDGTLATLASNLDCCRASSVWDGGDLPALTLTNAFTIGKFIIKNPSGTAINDDLTSVTISDGSNTYTITPTGSTFTSDPIWVAMQPIYGGSTVTVTATDGTNNYTKSITIASGKDLLAGKIYPINVTTVLVWDGALAGKFSVSSTKQVYFSQGNLQAVGTTSSSPSSGWTWQFAEHQYDYIGGRSDGGSEAQTGNNYINGNGTLSADGTVDLFCWSTNATYYGIQDSDVSSDYRGTFQDWGKTIDPSGTTWRTLTMAEWEWILGPSESPTPGTNCRTSSTVNGVENARYAKATVVGKAGLIIFPDSYTHPGDVTAPASVNTTGASYTANSYDATAWGKMEAAGAVFLPAAGSRFADNNRFVQACEVLGFYWSSVLYYNDETAHNLIFQEYSVVPSGSSSINQGMSVRLVKDAN